MGAALPLLRLNSLHPTTLTSPSLQRVRIKMGASLFLPLPRFDFTVGLHGIEKELSEGEQEEVHPVCGCDTLDVGGDAGDCGGDDAF